jgi:hypothetical protein
LAAGFTPVRSNAANGILRVAGMAATLAVIGAASLAILARAIY